MTPTMIRRFGLVLVLLASLFVLVAARFQGELVADQSYIEYEASDPRTTWTGRAPIEELTLNFNDNQLNSSELVVVVRPGEFDSGNLIRDANARRTVFETGEYPTATFRATGISPQQVGIQPGEEREVDISGRLELHGVTRDITVPATLSRENDTLRATGSIDLLLSDYDMTRPSFLGLTVDDTVTVRFDISVTLQPADDG
ncbi:MAG: YceI family protein [Trueperaceae bacterium]|nr:YceI family protein [Trueperaceae bacterium]